jgi:hypothetical protein
MKVTVVFDPDYGAQEQSDLGNAYWLVESEANRALATRVWASGAADPNSAIFKTNQAASREDEAISKFEDVDLHHPAWTEIEFVGVSLTWKLERDLSERSLAVIPTQAGFLISRRSANHP